jgi:Ssp1 endopeptidase immunity protein Rap1a
MPVAASVPYGNTARMNRRPALCIAMIALPTIGLLWPFSSLAQTQTPNAFSGYSTLAECKAFADEHASLGQRAAGYFCAGELRALAYVSHVLAPELRSCVPANLSNGQLVAVAIQYVEQHPSQMNDDFMKLALQAYRQT